MPSAPAFGPMLRRWRVARRLTQEALAFDAEISTRHLSFLEGGKSMPSREMVLVLGSALDLPLRERNALLLAAGFAPAYRESPLHGAEGARVREALDRILAKHDPYPALVYDRRGDVMHMNDAARALFPLVLADPCDARASKNAHHALLSPRGLRPFLVDWPGAAACLLARIKRELASAVEDDPLRGTLAELEAYEGVREALAALPAGASGQGAPFLAMDFVRGDVTLRFFSTLTTLGTPLDVTAQELTIESFFPSDDATEALLAAAAPRPA